MYYFWRQARHMLHERWTLVLAILFAFIGAGSLGVGLLSIQPLFELLLVEHADQSLATIAGDYNHSPMFGLVIPPAVVDVLPTTPLASVYFILLGLCLLTIFGAVANFTHMYLSGTVAARTVGRIRQQCFEQAVHMPLSHVVTRGPSEFVARIVRDAADLQKGFISVTSKALGQLAKGGAALTVALVLQPKLTLIAIPTAIVLGVVLKKIGKRVRRGTRSSLQAQEDLLRIASESLQGLRAVKANTGEHDVTRRFDLSNRQVVSSELKIRTARAATSPIMETLAFFVVAGLAAIAAKFIIDGTIDPKRFMTALIALGVAGGSFRPLAGLINEIQAAAAPARRLCEIVDEPVEVLGLDRPELPPHRTSIVYDGVRFTYPGSDEPALRDINLKISHGQRIALVGPNGCGKTTLVSLLPRLLVPQQGRVLIDGIDINSVNLASLRRQIGVVTQETVLFRGTVADNIAFGMAEASRDQIEHAARRAHAHQFIMQIPGGYDANIAEQGASLSGGQRQRLAIARAILRDPSILILDEATSQIDAESEEHINQALLEFCKDRTAIVIAHRMSTVLNADRLVVMDAGRIVAEGPHDDLLRTCELYARLAKTQLIATQ